MSYFFNFAFFKTRKINNDLVCSGRFAPYTSSFIAPLYIVSGYGQNQFFISPDNTTTSIDSKPLPRGVHFYSRPNAKNLSSIAGLDRPLELDKWCKHPG